MERENEGQRNGTGKRIGGDGFHRTGFSEHGTTEISMFFSRGEKKKKQCASLRCPQISGGIFVLGKNSFAVHVRMLKASHRWESPVLVFLSHSADTVWTDYSRILMRK